MKGEVDHSIVTRWFKEFCLSYKNLDDQAKSGMPKTVFFKAMLQAVDVNLASSIQRVSGVLGISLLRP